MLNWDPHEPPEEGTDFIGGVVAIVLIVIAMVGLWVVLKICGVTL